MPVFYKAAQSILENKAGKKLFYPRIVLKGNVTTDQIAREIADVTISADNLHEIVTLKRLSTALMKRIHNNYRTIIGVNGGLIALGVTGVIMPTTSALLHNMSTLTISLRSMRNLLPKEEEV